MIAHASAAKEFYRDAVNHKRNRDLELGWVLESIFGKGIGVLDRKEWKQTKRPYWSTCFGATHVQNFNNIIDEYVNHYVHTLHGKVNVQEKLLTLMMDITIYVIYGKVSKDEREELSSLMNLQDEVSIIRTMLKIFTVIDYHLLSCLATCSEVLRLCSPYLRSYGFFP